MPVRVTCPSCATQLNIRDEHAGRSVKCPKCGSVIPPAAAEAPPPLPVPPPLPTPPADAGGSPSSSSRPTAKPAAIRPPRDRDDDDDRPKKKSRRRDEDDDDDRPRERAPKKSGGSGAGMVLGIIGLIFLVCCGGAGGVGYYLYQKGKQVVEAVESINLRVNRGSYERLTEGMTPAETEAILGPGKIANADQVEAAFPDANKARAADWKALAEQGRVVLWRNGDEYLLGGFHPSAANGRLQQKTFQPRGGFNSAEQKFATDEEAAKPGWAKNKEKKDPQPPIEIAAWNLAKMYKENPSEGDRNYKGRVLIVSGLVHDIALRDENDVLVTLVNPPPAVPPGPKVQFVMKSDIARTAWRMTRGQSVKLRGTCEGFNGLFVNLSEAAIENQDADPAIQVSALSLVNDFGKDADSAEKKYGGKQVWVTFATVVKADGNTLVLSNTKGKITIRATMPPEFRKQIEGLAAKPGGRVAVKGEFSTFADDEIRAVSLSLFRVARVLEVVQGVSLRDPVE